jgi:uncharacterized protein YjbI with pentapeptide repeats
MTRTSLRPGLRDLARVMHTRLNNTPMEHPDTLFGTVVGQQQGEGIDTVTLRVGYTETQVLGCEHLNSYNPTPGDVVYYHSLHGVPYVLGTLGAYPSPPVPDTDAYFNIWTGATTTGLNYTVGDVAHSNFDDTNLTNATLGNLRYCDLSGANAAGAYLLGYLNHVVASGANLSGLRIDGSAYVDGLDLQGSTVRASIETPGCGWAPPVILNCGFLNNTYYFAAPGTLIDTWFIGVSGMDDACSWAAFDGYVSGLIVMGGSTSYIGIEQNSSIANLVIIQSGFSLEVLGGGTISNVFAQGGTFGVNVQGTLADCVFGGTVGLAIRPGGTVHACSFIGTNQFSPVVSGQVSGCNFSGATIPQTDWAGVVDDCLFHDATFNSAIDAATTIKGSDLSNSSFVDTVFSNTLIWNSNLNGTILDNADLTNAQIINHDLHGQDLAGNNYRGLTLGGFN